MAGAIALVLAFLGGLHVFWGLCGMSPAFSVVVPEVDGKPAFRPSRLSCFAVAAALATAAALVACRGGILSSPVGATWIQVGTIGVGAVFVLRAIGDFRLVGFFKKVRGSGFARWDTRLYSPLCLALGIGTLWVALAT